MDVQSGILVLESKSKAKDVIESHSVVKETADA